jgi:protein O-mannosyl-transferase
VSLAHVEWRAPLMARRCAWPLLVVVAAMLAYANSFAGGFQFDDFNVIVREAGAQSPAAWWASQPGIRPLLKLTYALNRWSPFGLAGLHAVNLLIHLANSVLVAALLMRLVPAAGAGEGTADGRRFAAWLSALVYALHPVQTEAVTYLSGRSTSLAAFFALASIVCWLRGEDDAKGRWHRPLSLLCFVAALLCKEYTAVLPLALLLCASMRAGSDAAWLGRAMHRSMWHWMLLLAALLAASAVPRYRVLWETSLGTRDLVLNLATQVKAVAYLAGQLLRPDRLNADPALPVVPGLDASVWLHGAVLAALLGAGLWAMSRHRVSGFAVVWFFLWLAPTNSLLPRLDVANDRQLYVAMIGPAFALACLLAGRASAWRRTGVVVVALALGAATFQRNLVYRNEVVFWADVTHKSPHHARAFANLGFALASACRPAEARSAFQVALALDPGHVQAAVNLQLLQTGAFEARATTVPDPGAARCAPRLPPQPARTATALSAT